MWLVGVIDKRRFKSSNRRNINIDQSELHTKSLEYHSKNGWMNEFEYAFNFDGEEKKKFALYTKTVVNAYVIFPLTKIILRFLFFSSITALKLLGVSCYCEVCPHSMWAACTHNSTKFLNKYDKSNEKNGEREKKNNNLNLQRPLKFIKQTYSTI